MTRVIKMVEGLPHFACGQVIKGFNRGSKELGIPTANFGMDVVNNLPKSLETGVYYGWASVNNEAVHKMVMSIGWNPFYKNEHKSMETHILHDFTSDFYGSVLKVCIVGYLRPEKNFDSLDALIKAIKKDISDAENLLEDSECQRLKADKFFSHKFNSTTCADDSLKSTTIKAETNGHS